LESTHNRMDLLPGERISVHRVAGDRTSWGSPCCHLLCLLDRFAKVSRDARPAWEVSPLARGVMLRLAQLLSTPLQDGLRLLPRPLPAPPSARLTTRFPFREGYGLTTFRTRTMDEVGSACSPVARHLREVMQEHLHLATSLLGQASQPLWLGGSHDVYRQFTSVSHVIPPLLPTAVGLAVVHVLSRGAHHLAVRLRCPKSFIPPGCPGRMSW
jgi:hypothetical protein